MHFARPVGTFLVCRRKLSEQSSKVQVFLEGRGKAKKSRNYIWHYLVSSKKLEDFFRLLWPSQNILTLRKNVRPEECAYVLSEVVLLFSCIFVISRDIEYLFIVHISTVRKFMNYLVKSQVNYGIKETVAPLWIVAKHIRILNVIKPGRNPWMFKKDTCLGCPAITKGQLISECPFDVWNFPKKNTKIFD